MFLHIANIDNYVEFTEFYHLCNMNKITTSRQLEILELLHREVKPALGCTEPTAVALAVAKACELLREIDCKPIEIETEISANILKNGMGVGIPGTGMVGLPIAAALACTCGKSQLGLEVLKDITPGAVEQAKMMVADKKIKIVLSKTDKKLFIKAICKAEGHTSQVIIQDNHDSIVYASLDDQAVIDKMSEAVTHSKKNHKTESISKSISDYHLNIREIFDFATQAPIEDIKFILKAVDLNRALAREGLLQKYGLQVGRTIQSTIHRDVFGHSLLSHCMATTAAASDARMAGCTLPAMSNSGSGNQGITATMPVVAAAELLMSSYEEMARALVLSHLVAILIKGHLGKLSALCGCVIASTGSACGIVYLDGGNFEQVCYAIKNMIGNITGMVCDGAKVGCALKVASGVSSAVQSAILALDNICISDKEGIIEHDVEKTIRNLGNIGSKGMQETDQLILDIMICK